MRVPMQIEDVTILAYTYPWWKRMLTWLVWRTPLRYAARRRWRSPYGQVVAVFRISPFESKEKITADAEKV